MNRYAVIDQKLKREIVLLKAAPCRWGKCAFCDYIEDNSIDERENDKINQEVLSRVTGKYGVLEVIDSASVFELSPKTKKEIGKVAQEKNIGRLFFEAHWIYRYQLDQIRRMYSVPITFKTGVETFDNDFRQKVLKKGANFSHWKEVKQYFDSPCIMVGIQGQTRDMVRRDMDILLNHFELGTVNLYQNNTTTIVRDEELVQWFQKEYAFLKDEPKIDILFEITDFGVG